MFTGPTQSSYQKHPWFDRFSPAGSDGGIEGLNGAINSIYLNENVDSIQVSHHEKATELVVEQLMPDEFTDTIKGDLLSMQKYPSINTSLMSTSSSLPEISMSPAAMFLSGFSPSVAAEPLPGSEGQVVAGYTLGPVIGYGGFSTIRRGYSLSGGTVAVKIVERFDLAKQTNPTLARKRLDHEAAVWASLSHEHILPLFSTLQTARADYFFTLYCPAGSLFDIMKRDGRPALPHDDVGTMFRQVVRGLRYMHEVAEFVHRDIKLENVLVDEMGVCKIGDFGMAKKIGEEDEEQQEPEIARPPSGRPGLNGGAHHLSLIRHTGARHRNSSPLPSSMAPERPAHFFQPGSLPYASPELLLPQMVPSRPDPAQDIWALGVLLYVMLTGRLPFYDTFEPRIQQKILRASYEVPLSIGHGAEQVLQGCLERSVPNRWTIAMVDEVAWDIGWSSHEDNDLLDSSDGEAFDLSKPKSVSRSRSQSRPSEIQVPDFEISRPSLKIARRRSSSREQRSLSHAPAPMSARSKSRSTPLSPTFPAVNNPATPSSSSPPSAIFRSALPSPLNRGRRLEKLRMHSPSRSPTPSVVPTTPLDFEPPGHFPIPVDLANPNPDASELGTSRGHGGMRTDHVYVTSPDLDMDETSSWVRPRAAKRSVSASAGRSPRLDPQNYGLRDESAVNGHGECLPLGAEAEKRGRLEVRPGSTPPAPSAVWPMRAHAQGEGALRFSEVPGEGFYRGGLGLGLGLGLVPGSQAISGRNATRGTRSRSVGWECIDEFRRSYE